MLRNARFATTIVTVYLAVYCILFLIGLGSIMSIMFTFSPIMVIWMVVTVLKNGKYTGTALKEDEEWGYEDKSRDEF